MRAYKKIKTNMFEMKFDVIFVMLIIFIVFFALASVFLANDNKKLLKQVDDIDGKYNEVCYQSDLINNAYEDLKRDYEELVDYIRTSDKYDMPEGWEE